MRYIATIVIFSLLAACEQAPRADKAQTSEARSVKEGEGRAYPVDTAASELQWIGTKPTGKHTGIFRLQEGTLYAKDDAVTGGRITINMQSLRDLDLAGDPTMQHKLETELKGPLFFDVETYPTAVFEITGISDFRPSVGKEVVLKDANYTIQGNLKLKNITKNISFPASIRMADGLITAQANFNIDRTQWGMTYRADKSVQDKLINSQVNIQFKVVAKH